MMSALPLFIFLLSFHSAIADLECNLSWEYFQIVAPDDVTLILENGNPTFWLSEHSNSSLDNWYIHTTYDRISEINETSGAEIWGIDITQLNWTTTCQPPYYRKPQTGLNGSMAESVVFTTQFETSQFLPKDWNRTRASGVTSVKVEYSLLYNETEVDGCWDTTVYLSPYSFYAMITVDNWVNQSENSGLQLNSNTLAEISVLDVYLLANPKTHQNRGVGFLKTIHFYISEVMRLGDHDLTLDDSNGTIYNVSVDHTIEQYYPPIISVQMSTQGQDLRGKVMYYTFSIDTNIMVGKSSQVKVYIGIIIGIVIVVIAALGVTVFFVWRHQKKANRTRFDEYGDTKQSTRMVQLEVEDDE